MSVRIIYKDVAPGAAEDAAVTATGADEVSSLALLPFGSGNNAKYATLERNLWALDGTRELYDGGLVAFWSEDLSDENGEFSTSPVITIAFDAQYTSLGIYFEFGADGWCTVMNIAWYRGNLLLASRDFHPTGASYFADLSVSAYNKVVITFQKTSLPLRRICLDKVLFGIVRSFERAELRNVSIEQEIDPTSRTLAANALDWTLSSKDSVAYIFQKKQPVLAYDGSRLFGTFYITDSKRVAERVYDITTTDAIGVMDDDPFPDVYWANKNAYEAACEICAGYTVEMDNDVKSESVTGVLVGHTRRTALQQLCFALRCIGDTSGSEGIKIFRLQSGVPITIEPNRTRTGGSVMETDIVTAVELTAHSYSTSGGSGDSVEIGGVTYYDTPTVTRIDNPEITANDKANVVSVADATLISAANVSVVAQYLYDRLALRRTHDVAIRVEDEDMGDYLETATPWGDTFTGHYIRGSLTLSGIVVSNAEVIGS